MNPLIQLKQTTSVFLVAFGLACFGVSPVAQAVSPPPDGGYPNLTTAEGDMALDALTSGLANTAVGWFSLSHATTGSYNTGIGAGALDVNNGNENTATGVGALLLNTTGQNNTANGAFALVNNTTGEENTAVGDRALQHNTTGIGNTAVGQRALQSNATGAGNTATGDEALFSNFTGADNTAIGSNALPLNETANGNTAVGSGALLSNTTGEGNVAVGRQPLISSTVAGSNVDGASVAIGDHALHNAASNTGVHDGDANNAVGDRALELDTTGYYNDAFGYHALHDVTTGAGNTAVGDSAGIGLITGNGNVYIGAAISGVSNESNHTYIRNVNTTTVSGGGTDTVTVNLSNGLVGHASCSRRYKEDIKPMDNASETLYRLKPVTYRYKKEVDQSQSPAFGLIAEEVAEANPNLVARNSQGQPESVHYEAVNAMLLNEFLKEHRKVEQLEVRLAQQEKDFTARLKEQDAKIQQVSNKVELSKAASRTVDNQ